MREIRQTSGTGTHYTLYDYNGNGRLVIADYPAPDVKLNYYSGSDTTYSGLDRFGRVKDQLCDGYNSTADVSRVKHGYDYANNRKWREDVIAANNSKNHDELYTYDGLHRVIDSDRGNLNSTYDGLTAGSKNFAEQWFLDALGNWSTFEQDTDGNGSWDLSQLRGHNFANETTSINFSSSHVAHDATGNMTKVPKPASWSAHYDLTYDAWNRLVKVVDGTNTVAQYEYDGLNRRIVKKDIAANPDVTYDYYYNEAWQVVEVRKNADPQPIEQFIWHPYYIDALAVRFYDSDVDGSQVDHYYAHDANMNVVAVLNNTGTVLERYQYSGYGALKVLDANFAPDADGVSDIANSYTYTGREFDAETGLYHYRYRYYHAQLGRFVGRDPIGYRARYANLYGYVGSSPVGRTDPSGLDVVMIIGDQHTNGVEGVSGEFVLIAEPLDEWVWEPDPSAYALLLSLRMDEVGPGESTVSYFSRTYYDGLTGSWYGGAVSTISDFVPGLSGIKGGQEFLTGFDVARGEELGRRDQVIAGMGFLPGGKWLGRGGRWVFKKGKGACRGVWRWIWRKGDDVAEHVDDVLTKLDALNGVDDIIRNLGDDVTKWLGKDAKVITNEFGDTLIESADGLRQIRFDFNHPYPHHNPHIHLIEYKWVKNKKVEVSNLRIYPKGVTPK